MKKFRDVNRNERVLFVVVYVVAILCVPEYLQLDIV